MRVFSIIILGGMGLLLLSCAGSKPSSWEAQQARERALLQAQVDSLQQQLTQAYSANQALQRALQNRAAAQESAPQPEPLESLDPAPSVQNAAQTAEPQPPALPQKAEPSFSGDYQKDYERALKLANERDFLSAITIFQNLLEKDRNHDLSDNCQYWIGACYYAEDQFDLALAEFEKVFTFPNSNKSADAQFMVGMSYQKLGKLAAAKQEFMLLITNFPDSEIALRAKASLEQIP